MILFQETDFYILFRLLTVLVSSHTYIIYKTTSCTTSSFVYLKSFKELSFLELPFQRESVCKGKAFSLSIQIFSKFFRKSFSGGPLGAYPFLAPLPSCKVRYSGAAPLNVCLSLPFCHFQRLSLSKAVAKVRTFSGSATFMRLFFEEFLKEFCKSLETRRLQENIFWGLQKGTETALHYVFRAGTCVRAYMRTRNTESVRKEDLWRLPKIYGDFGRVLTTGKKRKCVSTKTPKSFDQNALAFCLKRTCVSVQTQGRFLGKWKQIDNSLIHRYLYSPYQNRNDNIPMKISSKNIKNYKIIISFKK